MNKYFSKMGRIVKGLYSLSLDRFKILAYHSIHTECRDFYEVSALNFERQMSHLRNDGYEVVSLAQALIRMRDKSVHPKMVVITFDDGFKSLQEHAFPLLNRFGFPATVFLPINYMGGIDGFSYENPRPEMEIMDWNDILDAKKKGITFGSHSLSHCALTSLDNVQLKSEIHQSGKILKDHIDMDVMALAYPFGMYDERVKKETMDAGYDCALGFGNVMSNSTITDRYELKREKIVSTTTPEDFKFIIDVRNDFKRKFSTAHKSN